MSDKFGSAKNPRFTLYCPITNKSVTAPPREQLALPDGKSNWWRCPQCNGWHVSLVQSEKHSPAADRFYYKPAS